MKADVAWALSGLPAISVPGVGSWRSALDVLRALGCTTVRLAFDADARDNPNVARALSACAEALTAAGLAVELERWDAGDGKGIDDVLTAGKVPELLTGDTAMQGVREILDAAPASAGAGPAPPEGTAPLPAGPYHIEGSCTCRTTQTKDGRVSFALCNFAARIVEDVVKVLQAERRDVLHVVWSVPDGEGLDDDAAGDGRGDA